MSQNLIIKGARVHNLKNVDVTIPRDKLVVMTGLSGSGKSSLAFDTIFAEGQRRYVESLSSYARQFLGRMKKPECDFIKGLPPAIAIEQKVSSRNPRSTVGTSTEIYEYLRLLFARVGKTYSPVTGQLVKKHDTEDIVACMRSYSPGTRFTVLAPLVVRDGRTIEEQLTICLQQGFARVEVKGEVMRIEEMLEKLTIDKSQLTIDKAQQSDGNNCQFNRNAVGFHIPGAFDKVLAIDECHLMDDVCNRIRNGVRDYAYEHGYTFFDLRTQEGMLRNMMIRRVDEGPGLMVVMQFKIVDSAEEVQMKQLLQYMADTWPEITSLMYVINNKCNDTIGDLPVHTFKGDDHIIEQLS